MGNPLLINQPVIIRNMEVKILLTWSCDDVSSSECVNKNTITFFVEKHDDDDDVDDDDDNMYNMYNMYNMCIYNMYIYNMYNMYKMYNMYNM